MLRDVPQDVPRTLARHDQRRRQGLATVSVLIGPVAVGARLWASHVGPTLAVDPAAARTPASLATASVAAAVRQGTLLPAALAELGRRLGRPVDAALGGSSEHDRSHLWRTVDGGDDDVLRLIRIVCTRAVEHWPSEVVAYLPGWRGVIAVDRLIDDPPVIWLTTPAEPEGLATIAGPVAALAHAVPR